MMKYVLITIIFFVKIGAYGQSNVLIGKTWAYKKIAILYQQDTVLLFHSDSVKNIYHLGKVSFHFKANGLYEGTDLNGLSHTGNWSMPNTGTIVVDKDTNQFMSLTNKQLFLTGKLRYLRDTVDVTGILLTVLYTIPPIISLCESLQTGDWTNTTTWSCGHVPTIADVVTINQGHTIIISTSSAQVQRIIYHGGNVRFTIPGTKIFIQGDS